MNAAAASEGARGRILLVDDTPATLLVLMDLLTEHGFAVNPAEEGALALRYTDSVVPDLVLLDIRMPGMDGFEVCSRLKQNPRTRDVPVIFLTAADQPLDKVKAFQCGAVDYVSKPFQAEEVLARVETHLALARLRRGLEETVRERTAELEAANARLREEIRERTQAEEALRASERRFAKAFRACPIPLGIASLEDGRIRFINEGFVRCTGYAPGEVIGLTAAECGLVEQPVVEEFLAHMRAGGRIRDAEVSVATRSGDRREMSFSAETIEVDGEESALFAGFDVTERKRAAEAERRLTRELRALGKCNEVLLRATDEQTLLDEVCRIICEGAGYALACVGYAGGEGCEARPVAWAGKDAGCFVSGTAPERTCGHAEAAIRCGTSAYVQDLKVSSGLGAWGEKALDRGYRSSIALPLKDDHGRTFGTLNIFSATPGVFTDDERRLLEELAADLAFGITVLRARAERKGDIEKIARLAAIVESTDDAIVCTTLDGIITSWNNGAERMYGYSEQEALGKPISILSPPGYEEDTASMVARVRYGEHVERRPTRRRKKNGQEIYISLTISPLKRPDGRTIGSSEISRDVTDLKEAEDALRESEQRYRTLLGSVTDYIYTVRIEDGRPAGTVHGPGCAAVTGYTAEDFARDPQLWLNMVYEADRAAVLRQAERVLAGEPAPLEHRIIHHDGSLRWVSNTPVCHYDRERRLTSYDGLISNITGHKRAEEEQAGLRQRLQQAQKMEAIGRLAGGVAHDFNNLLTIINGYSAMATSRLVEGDPLAEDLEQIRIAGSRAAALTQQLLAFSRKQLVHPKVISLNDQVRDAEKMLGRVIGEDVELVCELDPALWPTKADPGQIQQILMNLAVNARDAMPSGGRLVLKTSNEEKVQREAAENWSVEPGSYVELTVSDTGTGMTEEVKSHLFEPFFTTKAQGKGTGLGLATIFGILRQSGGHISVSSEPGCGATFRIFLPRAAEADIEGSAPPPEGQRPRGSETILVVEDQAQVRKLTCEMLRSLGYGVIEAANGGEALLVCESRANIDLILTDVVMPQMSGPALVSRLRVLRPEIVVLYMSGYSEGEGLRDTGAGSRDYLQKPFSIEELAHKVREVLGRAANPGGGGE